MYVPYTSTVKFNKGRKGCENPNHYNTFNILLNRCVVTPASNTKMIEMMWCRRYLNEAAYSITKQVQICIFSIFPLCVMIFHCANIRQTCYVLRIFTVSWLFIRQVFHGKYYNSLCWEPCVLSFLENLLTIQALN